MTQFVRLKIFETSRHLPSLSFSEDKDFFKVKGQRVAEPINERLPSARLALARPTFGIAG